jgi:hypothetical protein
MVLTDEFNKLVDDICDEKQYLIRKLENAIQDERKLCECEERLGYIEDGDYSAYCDGLCEGCRNYDPDFTRCDIYENVRVALEEDAQYERLGLDDYS